MRTLCRRDGEDVRASRQSRTFSRTPVDADVTGFHAQHEVRPSPPRVPQPFIETLALKWTFVERA